MKDERLSPEEMKGLLNKVDSPAPEQALGSHELGVLKELFCTAFGGTAALRDPLFPETAAIEGPVWTVKSKDELFAETKAPVYVALGEYSGLLKMPQIVTLGQAQADAMASELSNETDSDKLFAAVQDMLVRLFGSSAAALSMVSGQEIGYSLSGMDILEAGQKFPFTHFTKEQWFAEALFTLTVGNRQNVAFRMYLPAGPCRELAEELAGCGQAQEAKETQDMSSNEQQQPEKTSQPADSSGPSVQSVQFSSFDEIAAEQSAPNNLDMLLDIPLQVTVELGRTKRMVKEILEMSQGSIVELDKLAGEPVDILINNKLIAVGEVVVIDENFGVRVTDILSTAERISKLR
ncbi:flagellar motor switch protein FliN [Planococcus plakortidis]|uniref:flagellar motor switch protein FliN n=1 Tax=Planococcus plakortidis TaxID=1038856 RepID=UPI00385BB830